MVLCDGGFLLSTSVSMMMNGVCCVYQMNGEKELRQAMRTDIREEWKQQREAEAKAKLEEERLRLRGLKQRHKLLNNRRLRPAQMHLIRPMEATSSWEEPASQGRWIGVTTKEHRSYHNRRHCRDTSLLKKMDEDVPCLLDEELNEEPDLKDENPQDCQIC